MRISQLEIQSIALRINIVRLAENKDLKASDSVFQIGHPLGRLVLFANLSSFFPRSILIYAVLVNVFSWQNKMVGCCCCPLSHLPLRPYSR